MGWKSGVGKSMEGWDHKGKIVGVIRNCYFNSLHDVIAPLVMIYNTTPINITTVKIKPRDLALVKTVFKKNFPEIPIDYSFLDDIVEKQYTKDRITMSALQFIYAAGHPGFLSRFVWTGGTDCDSAHEGDQYPESIGCHTSTIVFSDDKGFFKTPGLVTDYCAAGCCHRDE